MERARTETDDRTLWSGIGQSSYPNMPPEQTDDPSSDGRIAAGRSNAITQQPQSGSDAPFDIGSPTQMRLNFRPRPHDDRHWTSA